MSSPPPIDPYLALGISKDADLTTIRSAHRKLVLKFHPDRIKDEAERVRGREEFQKVQQAYELLSDPAKRSRYDDRVKLAELRKESLGRELPTRTASHTARPPQFSASREFKDGYFYEERVPMGTAFFEEEGRFRDEPAGAPIRKGTNYERRSSAPYMERKGTSWKAGGISIDIAVKMQNKAASAREKVRERDHRAAAAKSRDQERRREASDKHGGRRAWMEDGSSSDPDTATYANVHQRPAEPASPPSLPRRSRAERPKKYATRHSDDEDDWAQDKHQEMHANARDYIQRAGSDRPRLAHRQDSSYTYFEPRDDRAYEREERRRDRDREHERERPHSSRSGRPLYSETDPPRDMKPQPRKIPTMPTATSAPANLKIPEDRRDAPQPHRSNTAQTARDHRREVPSMSRSKTVPSAASALRSENAPSRGSNLKHAKHSDTLDSGYGSSSPATPDMGGTSPSKYASSTRYHIVDEDEEDFHGHRTILVEPEDADPQTRSRSREHQRPPLTTSGTRSKASRAATAYTPRLSTDLPPVRPTVSRHESIRPATQPREVPHVSKAGGVPRERKNLYREVSSDEQEGGYRHRSSNEKIAPPRLRTQDSYTSQRVSRDHFSDDYPGSSYKSDLRHPGMSSRRPSVY